jgi:hypothetical protein
LFQCWNLVEKRLRRRQPNINVGPALSLFYKRWFNSSPQTSTTTFIHGWLYDQLVKRSQRCFSFQCGLIQRWIYMVYELRNLKPSFHLVVSCRWHDKR